MFRLLLLFQSCVTSVCVPLAAAVPVAEPGRVVRVHASRQEQHREANQGVPLEVHGLDALHVVVWRGYVSPSTPHPPPPPTPPHPPPPHRPPPSCLSPPTHGGDGRLGGTTCGSANGDPTVDYRYRLVLPSLLRSRHCLNSNSNSNSKLVLAASPDNDDDDDDDDTE